MLCDKLKARTARSIADEEEMLELGAYSPIESAQIYLKQDVDKLIADLEESHKKEVGQLLIEIIELKKERRWRKFPEEKPKWGEEVLVVDDESKQYIVRFSHDMKWISWGKMNTCESNCVKYWMPLPPAPKEAK